MSVSNEQTIPSGWVETELSTVTQINPSLDRCILSDSVPVDFVPMRAVEPEGGGLLRPEVSTYGEVKKGYTSFITGDVIMAKITPCMENGKTCVVPELPGAACFGSTEFHVLRPEKDVEARWIANYLLQHSTRHSAQRQMMGGVGQMRVPAAFLEALKIPIPPHAEQQRILETTDELLSDLDAGVATLERVQAKLKHYRASVLKAAVEGTLTADWRAQHPDAEPASELLQRILAERRRQWEEAQLEKFRTAGKNPPKDWKAKYQFPDSIDLTTVPPLQAPWCWTNLDSLIVKGPQNGAYYPADLYGSGSRILRIDDYQNGWVRDTEQLRLVTAPVDETILYSLSEGDLVINRVNSMTHIGKCVVASKALNGCLFESNMMRARLASLMAPRYIELYLHSSSGRQRLIKGAKWAVNQASINQQDVKRTAVPLPPRAEQDAIVEVVEDQLSLIDHLEADLKAKLASAQALRQSILRSAFTGKLVPQDPNDEPASELLKRIAAAREERIRQAKAAKSTQTKTPRGKRAAKTLAKTSP